MKSVLFLSLLLLLFYTSAQENINYQLPSQEILALADYERAPSVSMDTKKEYMLLSYRNTYKTLDVLNQEEIRLGGLRINPTTNISSTITYVTNLKIRKINDKKEVQVTGLPPYPKIAYITWSPNEQKIAFTNTTSKGVELWYINVVSAEAKKITEDNLNANLGSPYSWMNDNETFLVKVLPQNRPALLDIKKDLPKGPTVMISDGSKSQNRTYPDLLKNKVDEDNFDALVTSELYKVSLNGTKELFMPQAIYAGESFSPDGNYLLLTTIKNPILI
jgi:hypothetical protein